jgi:hypothetical protein
MARLQPCVRPAAGEALDDLVTTLAGCSTPRSVGA